MGAQKKDKSSRADEPGDEEPSPDAPSPDAKEQVDRLRARIHSAFGQVILAMMMLPRYRHLSLADLPQMVMEPMMRDRIALASSRADHGTALESTTAIAIWASVSEEVDQKLREQIKAGVFPVRLRPDEWTSGEINWLLDVIAPNQALAASVIANLKQVVKAGEVRIHPLVTRIVGSEALEKLGARTADSAAPET